jgi:beta-N-acetylhexosaminidase
MVLFMSAGTCYASSDDPSEWSNKELAAQLLIINSAGTDSAKISKLSSKGVGGIIVMAPISKNIGKYITAAKKKSPTVVPFIASDEEGGYVQRFKKVIYPIPSANTMGNWSDKKIRSTTYKYAKKLKAMKVDVVLGPVLDLKYKKGFHARDERCFAKKPNTVWKKSKAWSDGFEKAGIVTTPKHWPGAGAAGDTHKKIATLAKLSQLEKKDMIPFNKFFAQGCDMVMAAHVKVPGLTKKGLPTSLSKPALAYLREKAGPDTVIITDSLSMGGATTSLHISIKSAVVKSLSAGADCALVVSTGDPGKLISAVKKAIDSGKIPRKQAIASVERILAMKEKL